MGHEITATDQLFTVREPGWHGLGQTLDHVPTREEAESIAHPFKVLREPVYRRVPVIAEDGTLTETYEPIEGQLANVRDDTDTVLAVMPATSEVVQNSVMYDIAQAIEGQATGSVLYETGGTLNGGRKSWLLIKMREPLVIKGDPRGETVPYYCLQNSMDGSGAFRGSATFMRVVCANTARMADLEAQARGTELVFRHTKSIHDRIAQAQEALAGWRESLAEYQLLMEHLLTVPAPKELRREFVQRWIPMPMTGVSERVRGNVEKAWRDYDALLDGVTCEGIDGTAYGLLAAAIEFSEHTRRAHTAETRFTRSWLNSNAVIGAAAGIINELTTV